MDKKIIIVQTEEKIDSESIANILARQITNGDYTGYLQRLAQKEQKKKAG